MAVHGAIGVLVQMEGRIGLGCEYVHEGRMREVSYHTLWLDTLPKIDFGILGGCTS